MKLTTWLKWGTVVLMTMAFIGGWTSTFTAEAQASTWHVAIDGSDSTGDGSQANPFATIQHGIDVATDSDTVLVHPGVYQENINFLGKNITVGSLFVTTGDEDCILQTVIDGQRQGHVVTFENGEAATAQLSGLTITNGYAQDTSWPGDSGGGVFCLNSSSPTLTHLRVSGNEAIHEGGGLYFGDCSSTVKDIVVTNNRAGTGGGGIRYSYGTVNLENVIVAHNSAELGGSGIQFYHSPGLVKNSVIADNFGGGKGGGLHFDGCSPTFLHVSIVGNWTSGQGGALNVSYMSQPTLLNSIVWGNVPEQIYFDTDWWGEAVTIEYSDIQGGEAGIVTNGQGPVYWLEGNMELSPGFVHGGLGNYRLADDSPCISAGKAAGAPATDIEGNPRPNPAGSPPDMGAYENPLGWLTVRFSSDTYGVVEGTGQAAITVTLNAASALTVTMAYSTTDGTAVAGIDYLTASGTLTFAPGLTNQAFSVPILDDEIDEPAETVSLTLSGRANVLLGTPGTAVLTIVDDDTPYRVYLPLVATSDEAEPWQWVPAASMSVPRSYHSATLLPDSRVMLVGGYTQPDVDTASVEIYDPVTNSYESAASLNTARHDHTATLLPDGRTLVVAGYRLGWLRDGEIYDPVSRQWSVTYPLYEHGTAHTASALQDGRVLVIAGNTRSGSAGADDRVEIFDPATNQWQQAAAHANTEGYHTATVLTDGRVLVAGGCADPTIYDPASDTWQPAGSLTFFRALAQAVLLQDGRVLLIGGGDPYTGTSSWAILNSVEVYDPASNTWQQAAAMTEPRIYHTATRLPDGRVLVVGGRLSDYGFDDGSAILSSVEIYDPETDTWHNLPPLGQARAAHTATLLPDGRVFVAGGQANHSTFLATTEIVTPDGDYRH